LKIRISLFLTIGIFFIISSCGSFGIPAGKSWSHNTKNGLIPFELGTVLVDKKADWDSVEAETKRLLPLIFLEQGHKLAYNQAIKADAILIEREYLENWKTQRSISVEILIWNLQEKSGEEKIYLGAGRALLSGNKSLSSSKVLYNLLKLALSNALKALPK
jgi:hypothetical protein